MTETTIILNRTARPDSIEWGTPGKSGALKVYFDAANPAEMEEIISNAKQGLLLMTSPVDLTEATLNKHNQ